MTTPVPPERTWGQQIAYNFMTHRGLVGSVGFSIAELGAYIDAAIAPPVPPAARKLVAQWMRHEEPTPQRLAEMIDDLLATRDREVAELTAQVAEYEREEESDQRFDKALRDGTNAMMRECLGPEMYSRLWGYELERLGRACDWLRAEAAALLAERDALRGEVREARNLLAVVHRDGGQYEEGAGFSRAVQDAMEAVTTLRAQGGGLKGADCKLSNIWDAYVAGARDARRNVAASEADFQRAADAYVKLVIRNAGGTDSLPDDSQ